jgi:hypothetical protein
VLPVPSSVHGLEANFLEILITRTTVKPDTKTHRPTPEAPKASINPVNHLPEAAEAVSLEANPGPHPDDEALLVAKRW